MTVNELLEILNKCHPDYEIITQGCDCDGFCKNVEVQEKLKRVYLKREED